MCKIAKHIAHAKSSRLRFLHVYKEYRSCICNFRVYCRFCIFNLYRAFCRFCMCVKSTCITCAKIVSVAIFFAYAIRAGSQIFLACAIILFVIIDFAYAIHSGSASIFARAISLKFLHIYTCYQEYNRHMQFVQALRAFCMCNFLKIICFAYAIPRGAARFLHMQ